MTLAWEGDFLCINLDLEGTVSVELAMAILVEAGIIFCFLRITSRLSGLPILSTSSCEESEVVDLLPIPLRRALNFRLVAFMAG